MSNTKTLKQYLLLKEDNAYLLDPATNGKSIMISGAWGSGKTYFWQNEIEPELKIKLEDKACVYVSLYGKESLSDIKSDVYLSASGRNILSTEVATFGMEALSAIKDSDLAVGKAVKAGKALFDSKKIKKGMAKLKKGGVICFDDFERKSKNVDLNDLFGFISQLAINLDCKVIIILNNEVFQNEEAKIFSRVKEKTISKFFYFNPTIPELFESISSDEKYDLLDEYKVDILAMIKETEEINARIYTQVLDNCLEWLKVKNFIDSNIIRILTLSTFNFVLNHIILNYISFHVRNDNSVILKYDIFHILPIIYKYYGYIKDVNTPEQYRTKAKTITIEMFLHGIRQSIGYTNSDNKSRFTDKEQEEYFTWLKRNQDKLSALWKYGHQLYYVNDVKKEQYYEIVQFIKTGILFP